MVDTSKTNLPVSGPAPSLITKETPHPLALVILGEVIGAHWLGTKMVFYYADGHKALIEIDDDGDLTVADYEIVTC